MRHLVAFALLLAVSLTTAAAQPAPPENGVPVLTPAQLGETMYYVVHHGATVYTLPDDGRPYLQLGFREAVYLLGHEGEWSHVRTQDGARGYVKTGALSNVWIRVSKRKKTLYLYTGTRLVMQVPADFGYNAFADKERRGSNRDPDHWRTPEGSFFVVRKNPHSRFYKAFVLNYPTAEDARRGLQQGLISHAQHTAIVQAEADFAMPPMSTALGGMIEIHGDGTGASSNWTQGCVAVHNREIDRLWQWVEVGTPVLIEK